MGRLYSAQAAGRMNSMFCWSEIVADDLKTLDLNIKKIELIRVIVCGAEY